MREKILFSTFVVSLLICGGIAIISNFLIAPITLNIKTTPTSCSYLTTTLKRGNALWLLNKDLQQSIPILHKQKHDSFILSLPPNTISFSLHWCPEAQRLSFESQPQGFDATCIGCRITSLSPLTIANEHNYHEVLFTRNTTSVLLRHLNAFVPFLPFALAFGYGIFLLSSSQQRIAFIFVSFSIFGLVGFLFGTRLSVPLLRKYLPINPLTTFQIAGQAQYADEPTVIDETVFSAFLVLPIAIVVISHMICIRKKFS